MSRTLRTDRTTLSFFELSIRDMLVRFGHFIDPNMSVRLAKFCPTMAFIFVLVGLVNND